MPYLNAAISILSGIAVCIPLVIKLYNTVKMLINNKNWNTLVNLIGEQMTTAQGMFEKGADRKKYVMGTIESLSVVANYELQDGDLDKISDMIDRLCDMANVVGNRSK